MLFKFRDNFLLLCFIYVFAVLIGFLALSLFWLPHGTAIVGHDSGLPLNAKQFLLTRFYAWDNRVGFGLDNSANFGSLTIHFFDWFASFVAGVPYAGNFFSVFFWLGLIFLSGFIFAYQLKNVFGKPFVFILPILLTFNFYIFQSVFMLERAKFGIFSATIIALAMFLRMQEKKIHLVTSALVSGLVFSIFNGGGWFGVTLYAGVVLIVAVLFFVELAKGFSTGNFASFKRTLLFLSLSVVFYIVLNAYSILPYLRNFLEVDASQLIRSPSAENNKDWLAGISRAASFLNLFRFLGIPDWYGALDEINQANKSHPYANFYLNNIVPTVMSFIFPVLSFSAFLLAKTSKQKRTLSIFGLITLFGIVFTAGSKGPFGFLYEFLMDHIPGFFLLRSAFYKFGIFYLFGALVLFAFTVSVLIEKFSELLNRKKSTVLFLCTFLVLISWFAYHWVLFDPSKVFEWQTDHTTRAKIPEYIYEFANWIEEKDLYNERILLLPPLNEDWRNDAYDWGYWSLSPLPSVLTKSRFVSNWTVLSSEENNWLSSLYASIKTNEEEDFLRLSSRLNIRYVLLREDVLVSSSWSSAERPELYKETLDSFRSVNKLETFGKWELYKVNLDNPAQIYAVSSVNLAPDNFISLVNKFFVSGHTVGLFDKKKYEEIDNISSNIISVYDCLSCLLEKQPSLKSLPEVNLLPNSLFFKLKEKQEEKLLAQTKDPKSKAGDYLGLILRRTAELKIMIDLSIKEQYLLENMEVIREYLKELYSQLESDPENAYDFELVRQVLNFLNPVEREIAEISRNTPSNMSHRFGEQVLGILWDISRIKEFFAPVLADIEKWATEKVYKVGFPQSGEYTLFFSSDAFPQDLEGNVIFPETIKFTVNGEEKKLDFANIKEGWFNLDVGYQGKGEWGLVLTFPELPNLFNIENSNLEKFPSGTEACYSGRIKNFDKKHRYQVLISKTDRLRPVRVIFRDDNRVYSDQYGFLRGEDLFEVPAVAKGEFSRYIYTPSGLAKDISIYICSDDRTLPVIDRIIVREFFSPSILAVREGSANFQAPPYVYYKQINPIKYEGEMVVATSPYVLILNEKINPSWKLFMENDEGNWKSIKKHFTVDGYVNGWLIEQIENRKFKIEYVPQKMFYVGSVISLTSLLGGISWLVYSGIVKRKKD